MKGYKAIVPDLKPEEEAQILTYLKQAREQAVDFKNMVLPLKLPEKELQAPTL